MLVVPVTVHFAAAGSSGNTRLISCRAQANGTLQDLHQSTETQLETDEQLISLLYRGLAPALSSPLQDFTADQGLLPRLQARCCSTVHLNVQLPNDKSLELSVRENASTYAVKQQLEAAMGDQILLTHSLLSRDVKSGDLQDISGATIPELTSRSLVLLPKLHISVKQASGDTVQLVCCPAETTQAVMQKLWQCCCTEGRRLMLGSQRLQDMQSLFSSGVLAGSVLELAPADAADSFTICVRTMEGVRVFLEVWPDTLGKDILRMLLGHKGVPKQVHEMRVTWEGCRLCNNERLKNVGISGGALLDVFVEQSGGGGAISFADLGNKGALQKQAFSTTGPVWRIAGRGLNVEGECGNVKCKAFGHLVIDRKGFCCFNLLQDAAKCPLCSEKIEAITCAFVGCAWMFDGRKLGPEGATVCCSSEWQVAASDGYSRFTEDGNMVVWESLIICARPSHMTFPCPICYEGWGSHGAYVTSCKHAFHEGCLAAWHKYKAPATCPMCRNDLLALFDTLAIE